MTIGVLLAGFIGIIGIGIIILVAIRLRSGRQSFFRKKKPYAKQQVQKSGMVCKCGQEYTEDELFCRSCGSKNQF